MVSSPFHLFPSADSSVHCGAPSALTANRYLGIALHLCLPWRWFPGIAWSSGSVLKAWHGGLVTPGVSLNAMTCVRRTKLTAAQVDRSESFEPLHHSISNLSTQFLNFNIDLCPTCFPPIDSLTYTVVRTLSATVTQAHHSNRPTNLSK
jgi:hypothetical protein